MEHNKPQQPLKNSTSATDSDRMVLLDRAKKLAHIEKQDDIGSESIEVLTFRLADEIYGIEAIHIKEVYPVKVISTLPCVPKFIYGLINIRRRIYSIIDLRPLFDLPVLERKAESRIIILKGNQISFGLIADEVMVIRLIRNEELQPHIKGLTGFRNDVLKGVTKDRLILLDGNKLMNEKKLIINQ